MMIRLARSTTTSTTLKKRRLMDTENPSRKSTVEPANKHKVVHEELEKMRKASSGDDQDTKDTP